MGDWQPAQWAFQTKMAPNVMGKSAGTSGNSTGLSKWQYALIFGTPVAAGLAYWYFKRARDKKKNTPDTAIAPGKAVETTQANHSRAASDVLVSNTGNIIMRCYILCSILR